jgi:hypothetical protein|tara:strand:+ start:426 stop:623 length:198 start_codon:yes stop_codon:yes gene_type:complete
MNFLAAANIDLVQAWSMSWGEGVQFILVLVVLYWLKKRIDLSFAKKAANTTIYKVKIVNDSHSNI